MKTITIFISIFLFVDIVYSQELETVGAGVIDFFLTNPKTASRTNETETAALLVLRNLLNTSANRQQEMKVAEASRSQITINSSNGYQAQLVLDQIGNVYMLYNGTIYPISKSLIDEAKEAENSSAIKTSTLPSFDINYLEKEWEPKKEINFSHYKFYGAAMIEEIAKVNKVSKNDIYLKKVRAPNKGQFGSLSFFGFQNINYFEGNGNTCMTSRYLAKQNDYEMYIKREIYSTKIVTIFSCNWVKDFNDDGLSFSECQNIKRSFFENENIVLVAGYTSLEEGKWQLDVYESTSGKKVRSSSGTVGEGWRIAWIYLDNHLLQPGVYVYSFVVIINTKQNISKSEKFEILRSLN